MQRFTTALAFIGLLSAGGCDSAPPPQGAGSTSGLRDRREHLEDAASVAGHFEKGAARVPGAVDAFGYEISLKPSHEVRYGMEWQGIVLALRSTRTISSDLGSSAIEVDQRVRPGLIDIRTTNVRRNRSGDRGEVRMVPDKWADIRLKDISFPKGQPVYLRIRFRDSDEYYALTYRAGVGVRLVKVKAGGRMTKDDSIRQFAVLNTKEGEREYQCDNSGVVAREGPKVIWSRQIPLEGAPKEFRVVGKTLFVASTAGHSLYLRKGDGKIVYYHRGVLPGESPWDEILALARKSYAGGAPDKAGLYRYVGAAALLDEKRAAPFLIECIEKGNGLVERWWAVAALEHLNGNSVFWKDLREGQPWDPGPESNEWDIKRVHPEAARKAEIKKWEKVFGAVGKQLLTRPK